MKIGFIGFGEAAKAFTDTLREADPGLEVTCYDILFEEEGLDGTVGQRAKEAGARAAATPAEAIADADWIIAAVTAASSLEAAQSVAGHVVQGQVYVDINSVSPGRKTETAALLSPKDVTYVDMAVMAPVHPRGHRTPVLVAGALPGHVRDTLKRLDFQLEQVSETVGDATAIKMIRSVFVKGLEAITIEAMLAAETAGCLERIVDSLSGSFPGLGWPGFAVYELERSLRHGTRRAAEMVESGKMLDECGLEGDLARSIAAVHERMGALGASLDTPRFRELVERIESRAADAKERGAQA